MPAHAIKLAIDEPRILQGRAIAVAKGKLSIQGWAIGLAGIASIRVEVDGVACGEAYCGVRRQDVARAHPDYPDALLSGFGYFVSPDLLSPGTREIRVTAADKQGREHSEAFSVTTEKPEPAVAFDKDPKIVLPISDRRSFKPASTPEDVTGIAIEGGQNLGSNIRR